MQILTQNAWGRAQDSVFITGFLVIPMGRQPGGGRPKCRRGAGQGVSSVPHQGVPTKASVSVLSQPIQNSEIHLKRDGTPGHYRILYRKEAEQLSHINELSRSLKLSSPRTHNCFSFSLLLLFQINVIKHHLAFSNSKLNRT